MMLDLARWRLNSGGPLRQYRRHHARRQPPDYFAGKIGGIAVESVDLQYADVARQVPVGVLARAVARRVEQRYCTERPLARMGTVVSSPRRPTAARTRRSINVCRGRRPAQAPTPAASVDRFKVDRLAGIALCRHSALSAQRLVLAELWRTGSSRAYSGPGSRAG
jgi:hypothetical protein